MVNVVAMKGGMPSHSCGHGVRVGDVVGDGVGGTVGEGVSYTVGEVVGDTVGTRMLLKNCFPK